MSDSSRPLKTHSAGKSRRDVLRMGGAVSVAAATSFPLVGVARADNATLKIGYIACMSGARTDFGATDPWVLDRVKATLKNGLKIGGKNYTVEFILKDNQSDANQTNVVAKELILGEKCDLVLTNDGENIAGAADELADARGVPLVSTLSPWEAWFFGRHGSPDKGFPFTFHYCIGAGDVFNLYASMWNTVKTNKVVGSIYMDSPAGRGFSDPQRGLPPVLKKYDYKEVPTGFFQLNNDDFSNQIATLKSGGASIITGTCYPSHFTTFWNQAAQAGLKPDVVTIAGPFLFPSGIEALGDRGDGMSTEVLWNPHLPYHSSLTGQSAQQLADQYEKSTGKQWTAPLGISHSLWEVGIGALKAAAEPKNNKSVRDSIASLNIDTVLGPLYFGKSPIKSVAVQPLTGGQWRKAKSGPYKFDLLIVNSGTADVKPDAEFKLLSQLA
jgi:branched-chain amino acid transport system substrate-binding protein